MCECYCVSASLFSAYAPRKQQAVKWLCSVITVISCLHASGKINLGRKMECGKNILWGKKTFPSSCSREKKSSLLWKLAASFQNCLAIIFLTQPLAPTFQNDQRNIFTFYSEQIIQLHRFVVAKKRDFCNASTTFWYLISSYLIFSLKKIL